VDDDAASARVAHARLAPSAAVASANIRLVDVAASARPSSPSTPRAAHLAPRTRVGVTRRFAHVVCIAIVVCIVVCIVVVVVVIFIGV